MKLNRATYPLAVKRSFKMADARNQTGVEWCMDFSLALRINGLMCQKPDLSRRIFSLKDKPYQTNQLHLPGLEFQDSAPTGHLYPSGKPFIAPHPKLRGDYTQCNPWEENDEIAWLLPGDHREHRIVCAAIRGKDGYLLINYRHYNSHMNDQIRNLKDPDNFKDRYGTHQGFIDHLGVYHTRSEAFKIAKAAGQLNNVDHRVRHLLDGKELHSELLY